MAKIADIYYQVDPWKIIEDGFNPEYSEVSESVFSLGNEYMGTRGYFEEGYAAESLIGNYFNGIYERKQQGGEGYKGIVHTTEYMVNAVDWLYVRISAQGEILELSKTQIDDFRRELDMRTGLLSRSFEWILTDGKKIRVSFERLLSMQRVTLGAQRILLSSKDYEGDIQLVVGLDASNIHKSDGQNRWDIKELSAQDGGMELLGYTQTTGFALYSSCRYAVKGLDEVGEIAKDPKKITRTLTGKLTSGQTVEFERIMCGLSYGLHKQMPEDIEEVRKEANDTLDGKTFDELYEENRAWWSEVWEKSDIEIEGDDQNQQGIRFCIFQMFQTFQGAQKGANIGAKGLTGEAYNGNAFWDTETYCLPFYLFHDKEAARNLLYFRYATLPAAKERADALDCKGAFYPIATISGEECCNLWQHASLQLQASTAVAYGIWLYEKMTGEEDFLSQYGLEMLIEISRMLATRGDFNAAHTRYGFYCVMGPDEFQMMVNNNCYTNYMGKFTLEYTLEVMDLLKEKDPKRLEEILSKLEFKEEERKLFGEIIDCMYIPRDEESGLFEQHQGFFELPHVDADAIPIEDFPLYSHWSYDRIYRNDMIKQPDVLMFMLLFNSRFTTQELRTNYDFYEPKCIHESSLSPSVHSILASQLGKEEQAREFFAFATRMDLDNYNRNTCEGLHTTSIAAAWMNIVFGFGGLRCDGDILTLAPVMPKGWKGYSFRLVYQDEVIVVKVDTEKVSLCTLHGAEVGIALYGNKVTLTSEIYNVNIQ